VKTSKAKCGCVSTLGDREQWIKLCDLHEREYQATHQRWTREHQEWKERENVARVSKLSGKPVVV
jgi:hypothetical protein